MTNRTDDFPWQPRTPEDIRKLVLALQTEAESHPERAFRHPVKAAIYTRKSRIMPGQQDYSMEFQADDAEAYTERQNWIIHDVFADPHKTGRNSKRKELRRLKQEIIAGHIDVVVIHRIDRLYRNLTGLLGFIQLLIEHDVRLVSVTEQIDTSTPWGMLVLQVLGALAEMLVRQTSDRVRRMKTARAEKGLLNGRLPLGYCKGNCSACTHPNGEGYCPSFGTTDLGDGRVPVRHPIDQYVIQLIHHLYAEDMGFKEIADYINANRFDLPNGEIVQFRTQGTPGHKPPGSFSRDSIRRIITNPSYVGLSAQYKRPPLDMSV
ncbi:MAG: recombinase family protein [Anaerolineae bacterium]|nr:recombinase family protein [Anaerolineae bacterium]